jgi:hypothetical protein
VERVPGSHRDVTVFDTWPNSVVENFHELPSRDRSRLGAWCYTDRLSYVAGDTIRLHTCTTGKTYDVSIYRDGASRTDVFSQSGISGQLHETPLDCSVNGCGWPVALEVNVGDWKSGGYFVHIRAYSENGSAVDHHFPFAVRAAKPSATNAILLLTCTATWVAYNDWGGSNYYEGIEGENRDRRAFSVHMQRPFSRGFAWLAKRAAIMVGRYNHAHQFKRARRALKFLRTRLGRIIRDINRKIDGDAALEERFRPLLILAGQVRAQDHRQRGPKVYSLHAPEVECIGKGKARAPHEFGCKVSVATP